MVITAISGFLENAFFLKKSPSDTGDKQWPTRSKLGPQDFDKKDIGNN